MNFRHLAARNIFRYKSFYRLIAIAVIVAVAVIVGSLVVGDSVRSTLVKRVDERLGKTETIVFSRYSYLNDDIIVGARHASPLRDSRGILMMNGFVSVSGVRAGHAPPLLPVMVWGVDDLNIQKGQAKINTALHNEITVRARHASPLQQHIVLRLPSAGMVPLGSMFVTDAYTTSLRLELTDIISVEQGGNLNLKNEQTVPFNMFVNREELAEIMGVSGKINVILSDQIILQKEFASAWNYSISGLNVQYFGEYTDLVTTDRIFIQDQVVETLCGYGNLCNRFFTYLANSIRKNENSIPYSFITAVDFYESFYLSYSLNPDEIILSDYAAKRLNAKIGDTISISYFVSKQLKTLTVDSVFLRVAKIVPIAELQTDQSLKADFPGLSNVERCTDWNSDLPINLNLITDEDEDFWRTYKNTPKAIVPYQTLAPRWKNAFGSATALHLSDTSNLKYLTPEMFDIQLIYPRETAITAAKSGVDFSSLFLGLGFFIIISAAMLMMVPLSEMLFRRRDELNLLKAIGFSTKRIMRLLWHEANPVVWISAIGGVIGGLLYTYLVLFLLGTVWKGATHTEGFRLFPDFMTIMVGLLSGGVLSLFILYFVIRKGTRYEVRGGFDSAQPPKKMRSLSAVETPAPFAVSTLIRRTIRYNKKQALLSFVTLACGVLIVFSVGLNRRGFADSSQIRTATGGFALWVETSVPIFHNIQTAEGRAKLGLTDLSKNARTVQVLKYSADDASCLNLNRVVTPNVLGIDMSELENSDFKITKSISDDSRSGVYPALVDETVLQWSLGKKLGDTLMYMGEKGDTIFIRLVGTLENSIFQGSILIDKTLFSEIWSEISGSEIILVGVPEEEIEPTKTLISQALNNYGVRVMTTGERMKLFYSVTDTYLTIFLTLGGLGLLLGIFSFVIVVRKNLLARAKEITLYRSLGFDEKRLFNLLYKENIIIPLCAIFTGVIGSLLGVILGFGNVSISTWLLAIFFLVMFVCCVVMFVRTLINSMLLKIIW
jgi:putative ABC transport system permease protein